MLHILFATGAATLITVGFTYSVSRGILRTINRKAAKASATIRS